MSQHRPNFDLQRSFSEQDVSRGRILDIRCYEHIDELPQDCDYLFQSGEVESFDLSADWFNLLESKATAEGTSTRYYTLLCNGEVRGVLPLFMRCDDFRGRLSFGMTNYYSSLYRPLLSPSVGKDELAGYLQKILADVRVNSLRFDALDPKHDSFKLLEYALEKSGFKPFRFFCFGNWYLPVSGRSYEEYFQGLSSRVRNTIRRSRKKFLADGRGKLDIIRGGSGLEDLIAAWNRIYQASWKSAEPFPDFVPGLIRLCAARGWLRLGIAYYDDEPVGSQLWIVSHGRAVIYKLAYDERVAKLSVGTVLTAHLMEYVLDVDQVQEVDYLVGDDAYKRDWMDDRRERWGIVSYNTRTMRGLLNAGLQYCGELARRMKSSKHGEASLERQWALYPIKDFDKFAEVWDALNNVGPKSPILDSRFVSACLKHFGYGSLVLAVLGDVRKPDAMTILTKRRGIEWDTFQPAQAPIGFWLMCANLNLAEALDKLLEALPGFPLVLGITQQDPNLVPRLNDSKVLSFDYVPTARIIVSGSFEDYLASRGKNLRQNLRKARNRLAKADLKPELRCISDMKDVYGAIECYGRIESSGWKSREGTAVHLDNSQGEFYKDMLEAFCKAGEGRIYYLTLNETIVAMDLCIIKGDIIVILKTSYDETYKEYSPAILLHGEIFEELFQAKSIREIEFYGKVMDWHLRWTDDARMMYHVNAYRAAWLKAIMGKKFQDSED